ncbi:thioredoxin reductase (NADPH) [Bradyrhizobium sp. AZCC 1678]|uniref:thioredoxin-disulfide reductase n=1 Tax=Bradyrhizobium sp. AZCC 1678 TaxID=3117030 RepID=UPI002FF39D61
MDDSAVERVLILGAGPAGYTAAVYATRANLSPLLLTGSQPGGQLTTTTEVENWPSEVSISGPELVERMYKQVEHLGARIVVDSVTSVDLTRRPFICVGESGTNYRSDALIIATGARARLLGLPSESEFFGYGVSACATCDGFFYRGRRVVVIGGGSAAVEEALYLTKHASKVILVHRRGTLRAEKVLQARLFNHPQIEVIWNSVVEEVIGRKSPSAVTHVRLRNVDTQARQDIATDGVFVAIGHDPATDLFAGQLARDDHGYLITKPDSTATAIPGVFAAGDVKDRIFRQAVTAAGMGCMAAIEADRFLSVERESRDANSGSVGSQYCFV